MSELEELRASLARAQRELDVASDRLEALEGRQSPTATVLTPRGVDRHRRKLIVVGALSSLGTAALIGLGALLFSTKPPPTPVVAPPSPPAPTVTPPTVTLAEPERLPPPVVVTPPEPPRPPPRVARVNPSEPLTPGRAREPSADPEGMGALTIVCLPVRCDAITDNGVPLGPGHIFSRPVPAGAHHLVLHSPNGVSKTIRVEVRADQLREIRVSMANASDIF